ncbi:Uncharacterised protein [Chromobacterium violaceum]|uniref:Uncharacterized protein n=1 Tax=Chromobacterium violaceum TaxID=536 RepID=A0A447TA92_CHRVL|nr:Uncharacterised protein [Chromobacterium violaceum]
MMGTMISSSGSLASAQAASVKGANSSAMATAPRSRMRQTGSAPGAAG